MLLEFEKKLADFTNLNGLLCSADKILLAVSGGADSIALMYAVHALKAEGIFNTGIFCAHINHQLRGTEADLDEKFAVAQAKKLKLPVTTRRIDVREFGRLNKLSIETAARNLRMEALIDIAKASGCSRIATGHQKNDNAETVLQRMSRGTGIRGLGGIWPERIFAGEIKYVRPLLCFSRDEIIEYLQQRNLKWRCDHTNDDCTFRRNYIRKRLIPILQKDCSESIVEQLSQLAQSARRYYGLICSRVDELWPSLAENSTEKTVLHLKLFLTEQQPVKIELIRRSLANINCGERYVTRQHYERILQLAEQNVTGRKIELPGGCEVLREYGNLIFTKPERERTFDNWTDELVRLEIPGQARFGGYLIRASISDSDKSYEKSKIPASSGTECFDLDKIKPPLIIRNRCPGDRFVPLGQSREKKIGKFLTAQRVPYEVRGDVLVVADREKIIWIWPVRISEQAKITGETRKVLQLEITGLCRMNKDGEINEQHE